MILQSPRNCIKYEVDIFFSNLYFLKLDIPVTIHVIELKLSVCDHNILFEGEYFYSEFFVCNIYSNILVQNV